MNTICKPRQECMLTISPDGTLSFLWDDTLAPLLNLGSSTIRRASYVEPEGVAWTADLHPVGGPTLGPFNLRKEALDAEADWLLQHHLNKA